MELIQFTKGVYYISTITFWGDLSMITTDSAVEKKYLRNSNQVYGVYS